LHANGKALHLSQYRLDEAKIMMSLIIQCRWLENNEGSGFIGFLKGLWQNH